MKARWVGNGARGCSGVAACVRVDIAVFVCDTMESSKC